ncbi:MAG: sugar ABC transporter permease [Spirochaetaceae bacterium]|jgi:raffinose/stachyose/melibiose transport system permease protein|nr:sugar ABC transporter permease [Spirochaetaceae bacterium]
MTAVLRKNKIFIIAGLAPALIIFALFVLYPIARSFLYGFYHWNGLSKPRFAGIENFSKIFSDAVFWKSLKNNLFVVAASIFGQIPLGIIAAAALSGRIKGRAFFRTAFFIPMILSTVVVGLLWTTIFNSQVGLLRTFLLALGFKTTPDLLGNPAVAIYTLCFVIIWQFIGLYMIIFLAALQNIPADISEAADIDGANEVTKFFKIRLPLLWPTIASAAVLCISGSMRSFDLIYVMTEGGPAHATEVMATYMYNKTFTVNQYGYGSAVSLVIAVISFTFISISRKLLLRGAHNED